MPTIPAIPRDLARQLLYIGDVIDFDKKRRMVMGEVAGSRMPVEGPMGGGGKVIQGWAPSGNPIRRMTELEKFEHAVQQQRQQNMPSFNPRMTNPYPSKSMEQSFQERQPVPIRPQSPADTAQTSFPAGSTAALRKKMETALYGRELTDFERANLNRPSWE